MELDNAEQLADQYLALSPRSADLMLKAREEAIEGVRWAKDAGFSAMQVDEFRQFLGLVEQRFVDHAEIKDSTKLAEGSFGTIFKATYKGEKVAVKRIIKDASGAKSNPQRMREVLLEVSVNHRINHPNIVKFLGTAAHFPQNAKSTNDGVFLGMIFEFCDKGTIHARLFEQKGHKLLPEAKLRIAKEIATGLGYIHSLNIVHRDLSDRNVLICSDGRVKIADFGCARKILGDSYQPSTISGSPAFMAPEQLAGQKLSLKLDVWALGVIMWELFTVKVPWADSGRPTMGMQGLEVMKGIIINQGKRLPKPPANTLPPGFEPQTAALIDSFLQKSAASRPTMEEGLQQLEDIWQGIKARAADTQASSKQPQQAANAARPSTARPAAAAAKPAASSSSSKGASGARPSTAGAAAASPRGAVPGKKAAASASSLADKGLEARLAAFYKKHNPEKLPTVPAMAKQFARDEATLNAKLRGRYKADLHSVPASAAAPPSKSPPSARKDAAAAAAPPAKKADPVNSDRVPIVPLNLSPQDIKPHPVVAPPPKDTSPSLPAAPAPEAIFAVAPPPRTATTRGADQPTPGPRDESPTLNPLHAPPASPQRPCTMCPHRGPAGAADGYHQIMLAGGVRYNGLVQGGDYAGAGELVLIDNTAFPVRFPTAGEGGGEAGEGARVAELQQQVFSLMQEVARGRALAKQQAAEAEEERRRSGGLEVTVARQQGELEELRRREQDRRQYDELARRLGDQKVGGHGLAGYMGPETTV